MWLGGLKTLFFFKATVYRETEREEDNLPSAAASVGLKKKKKSTVNVVPKQKVLIIIYMLMIILSFVHSFGSCLWYYSKQLSLVAV